MIVESLRLNATDGDCHRCRRQEVPCVELDCSERDEGQRAVYSIRLSLRVSVCVECLRGVMETKAPPVLPATCGECRSLSEDEDCTYPGGKGFADQFSAPPDWCPLRKGAA